MSDLNKLNEIIDGIAIEINLSNLSSLDEIDKIIDSISSLSSKCDSFSLPVLSHALLVGRSALDLIKTNDDKNLIEDLLTLLCSSMKAALGSLEREENPAEYIKPLEEKLTAILSGTAEKPAQTFFDTHESEIAGFVSSVNKLLIDAYENIQLLLKSPDDKSLIDNVFRDFHTLKGEANLTGLVSIGQLSSEAENLLSALRKPTIKVDAEISIVLFKVIDRLHELLKVLIVNPSQAASSDVLALQNELKELLIQKKEAAALAFSSQVPTLDLSDGTEIILGFIAEANEHLANAEKAVLALEASPDDKEAINSIFRSFHTIKGAAKFLDLKDIQLYAHEAETMLDMVRKGSLCFEGRVVELSLSSIDGLTMLLILLQEQVSNNGLINSEYLDIGPRINALREVCGQIKTLPIGKILLDQGAITSGELQQALSIQKEMVPDAKLGDILVANKAASIKQIDDALHHQKSGVSSSASIRIQLDKLDALMDLVGELVISESQVIQSPEISQIKEQHFQRNLIDLDNITRNLQQLVMGMRLIQIGPVFNKMERLVRDLSKSVGKDIAVIVNGEDTEIDKNMAELIADPLMHMVRNALDHGIESKEERISKGKNLMGMIELTACHKGGFVVIEVKDDGRGLNRDKIFRKALERGLVKLEDKLTDNQFYNLIFEPGFSTADTVTEVSGRGVGMDVVKKNVERLHGKINISSQAGKGCVFTILFPITLAIVDGIVVQVGFERYVLPINTVIEFIQPKESNRTLIYGKEEIYKIYDNVYPLIHLDQLFNIKSDKKSFGEQTICIIESDHGRACVVVDELLGQQQVVIKSLGNKLNNVPGINGACILGDGRVGLILDASSLIELAGVYKES